MYYFKFHDLSKKTERLQKEISDSPPVWGDNGEDEQKKLLQVKKKWLKKQNREFKKLKSEQSQNRNIKAVISTLFTIFLIAIALSFLPKLWRITRESIVEIIPENSQQAKQGGFLDKLKAMRDEYQQKEKIELLVKACKKDPLKTPEDCQKIAETAMVEERDSNNQKGGKAKLGQQLGESLDSIDQYNKDWKKAIDMTE